MNVLSKKEEILNLFFQEPTKQWHFKHIQEKNLVADNKISKWLKLFVQKGLVNRIKKIGKMPYYVSNYTCANYQIRKRLYSLNTLFDSGLLTHLQSLNSAKTIIIFGSIVRGDWHKDSDIDIFIYGSDSEFDQLKYESLLGREIQLFTCKNKTDLQKLSNELLKNIIKGDLVKGDLDFLKVDLNE